MRGFELRPDLYVVSIRRNELESVESRLATFGNSARMRTQEVYAAADVAYPPAMLRLVVIKAERILHVYGGEEGNLTLVMTYPVKGQSGELGPKLREGDRQVPEGIYQIEGLNPNSAFYLSMRLNYPNDWDLQKAKEEDRDRPGSDIYIHGKTASVGCLAMGDPAMEELFTLVADAGMENVRVIIAPVDFRQPSAWPVLPQYPSWISELYLQIRTELAALEGPDA